MRRAKLALALGCLLTGWTATALEGQKYPDSAAAYAAGQAAAAAAGAQPGKGAKAPLPPAGFTGLAFGGFTATVTQGRAQLQETGATITTVSMVLPGSPGEKAGVAQGDIFLEVNGADLRTTPAALRMLPGKSYVVRLRRGQEELEVTIVPDPPRPWPAPSRQGPPPR